MAKGETVQDGIKVNAQRQGQKKVQNAPAPPVAKSRPKPPVSKKK